MVTRKTTQATKATIIDTPFVETLRPEAAQPDEAQAFTAYFESLLAGLPSWKRVLCSVALSLVAGMAIGYVGGIIIAVLMVGTLVLGAPTFLAQIIYVLGLIVSTYLAYRAGKFIHLNVIDKTIDAKCSAAYSWVTGLFTSAPKGVAA